MAPSAHIISEVAMGNDYFAEFEKAMGDIVAIGNDLGKVTEDLLVPSDSPTAMAMTLYARSWSHFRAFTILYKEGLILEAEMILRGSIEVAICLANLEKRGKEFLADLDADLSDTMVGQLKMMQKFGLGFADQIANEWANEIAANGKRLNFEKLAGQTNVGDLYVFHRVLSGTASHITGISVTRHLALTDETPEFNRLVAEAAEGDRRRAVYWMVLTMTALFQSYATIIESQAALNAVSGLLLNLQPALEQYAAANGIPIVG